MRFPGRRFGLELSGSCFIAVHLAAIFLNALPWSPVVAKLYPFYGGYINKTGQAQIWSMYSTPLHYDAYFEVIAVSQSGAKTFPMGECSSWSPRELYFIEGLFNADRSNADAFMAYLAATYKGDEKLSEVRIIMSRSFAPNYGSYQDNQPHQYIFYREFKKNL